MCTCVPDRIGISKCWFLRREENLSTRRKTSRSKERTNNKPNAHMTPGPRFEPRPHWWEASPLTTAPTLLPKFRDAIISFRRIMSPPEYARRSLFRRVFLLPPLTHFETQTPPPKISPLAQKRFEQIYAHGLFKSEFYGIMKAEHFSKSQPYNLKTLPKLKVTFASCNPFPSGHPT